MLKEIYLNLKNSDPKDKLKSICRKTEKSEREKAIEYCHDFGEDRDWCFSQGIDYRGLEEEIKFQTYLKEYKFMRERERIRFIEEAVAQRENEIVQKVKLNIDGKIMARKSKEQQLLKEKQAIFKKIAMAIPKKNKRI